MSAKLRSRYPADITGVVVLRAVGCHVDGANVRYSIEARLAWVVVGLGLLVWHLASGLGRPDPGHFLLSSVAWSVYFLLADVLFITLVHRICQGFLDLTVPLELALTRRGRQAYADWYARASRRWPQIAAGLVVALASIPALWITDEVVAESGRLTVVPASYAVLALTGFVVGVGAYWGAAGVHMCWRLGRRGRLRLYPLEPARTPGLEELSHLMLTTFTCGVVAVVVILFPILYCTADVGDAAPALALFGFTRTILIAACGIVLIAVGVLPQVRFSRAIQDARRASLTRLLRLLQRDHSAWTGNIDSPLHARIALVAGSSSSILGVSDVVQIAVGATAIIVPTVVSGLS